MVISWVRTLLLVQQLYIRVMLHSKRLASEDSGYLLHLSGSQKHDSNVNVQIN